MTDRVLNDYEKLAIELERSRGELQTILDHFPGFIFYKNTENVVLRVNRAMAQSLGLKPEEMAGRHARDFYPDFADAYYQDDLEVIRSGRPKLGIVEPFDLEGGKRGWIETNKIPIKKDSGEVIGILGISIDVTARMQAREERERLIQELAQELDSFTSTMSHDLKSPIVTLKGFLKLLESDLAARQLDRAQDDLAHVQKAADSLADLVEGMLELARAGHREIAHEEVNLAGLVEDVLEILAPAIAEKNVQVEVTPGLPVVSGERSRLVSLYKNLVENAVKYMDEGPAPRVEIGTRQEGGELVFYVRDNGRGIDPEHQADIFKIFQRMDAYADVEGTGIGLAIAERAVVAHGGRIWVESTGQGRGSTFCFTLEAAEPQPVSDRVDCS